MDLTINAYRPVQRPAFKGDVGGITTSLIIKGGKAEIGSICSTAKIEGVRPDESALKAVEEDCINLCHEMTEYMKKFFDNISLIMRLDNNDNRVVSEFRYHNGVYPVREVKGAEAYRDVRNEVPLLDAIKSNFESLKSSKTPEIVYSDILDHIMQIPSDGMVNINTLDNAAKEFATKANILEKYNAKRPAMLAEYNRLCEEHQIEQDTRNLEERYKSALDNMLQS